VREVHGAAPASWALSVDGAQHVAHDSGAVSIAVGGRDVRIRSEGLAVLGEPTVEHGGCRELGERAAPRFDGVQAAPYAKASLAITRVAVGDRVEVWGDVVARDGAGAPTEVSARILARGAHAAAAVERALAAASDPGAGSAPSPRSSTALTDWLPTLVCLAAGAAWTLLRVVPLRVAIAEALALYAAAAVLRPTRGADDDLVLRARERAVGGVVPFVIVKLIAGVLLLTLGFFYKGIGPRWIGAFTAGAIATWTLVAWIVGAKTYLRAGRLLGARAWRGSGGERALVIGKVVRAEARTLIAGTPIALGIDGTVEDRSGSPVGSVDNRASASHGVTFENLEFHGSRFAIESDAGTVEVSPDELWWCSTDSAVYDERRSGNTRTYRYRQTVAIGAGVAALGRIDGTPAELRASGTEPALLFAAEPGGDPRAAARRVVGYWRGALLGTVLAAASAIALALTGS